MVLQRCCIQSLAMEVAALVVITNQMVQKLLFGSSLSATTIMAQKSVQPTTNTIHTMAWAHRSLLWPFHYWELFGHSYFGYPDIHSNFDYSRVSCIQHFPNMYSTIHPHPDNMLSYFCCSHHCLRQALYHICCISFSGSWHTAPSLFRLFYRGLSLL